MWSGPGSTAYVYVGSSATNVFSDASAALAAAYLYRVKAVKSETPSVPSGEDLATTVGFADDPIVRKQTTIRAVHLTQLQTAVNAVRALVPGMSPASFSGPAQFTIIDDVHVLQLRAALDEARASLGLPALNYENPLAGVTIKADHIEQLRGGVR